MTRDLLLMRHGKSDHGAGAGDFERPLKDRGKRAAQRVGVWLLQQGLVPDHIVTSPAERALVTAQKLCKAMGRGDQGIRRDQRAYLAAARTLLEVLADTPASAQRVLLVGHNPGLEDLLMLLTGGAAMIPVDAKLLPTAALARLVLADDWNALAPGCALLEAITRPADLPQKFPYPGPGSDELRDRPAYYYTQSSVIPYRLHRGRLEILVIASSKQHHLVVPKGIKDPGLSPQDSAAREAWEEAGVEGEIPADALGEYRYFKWGAICTVTVYAMRVERMVPEEQWEERHRGRRWMTPDAAAEGLKQQELRPLLKTLAHRL